MILLEKPILEQLIILHHGAAKEGKSLRAVAQALNLLQPSKRFDIISFFVHNVVNRYAL
jgi:hypothetical protein